MKIYCISDIHGCLFELEEALFLILKHLNEDDTKLILLGDYIHGGGEDYEVLDRIMSLQDKYNKYGEEKVIALRGNHEDFVLDGYSCINEENNDYQEDIDDKYYEWMHGLPTYYTEGNTIFVHAGIDEEAGEDWEWGTSDEIFTAKYPASIGKINGLDIKVVAGHVGTSEISGDPNYHGIYYDGKSHYYIDGSTTKSRSIPVLLVDTDKDKYYKVTNTGTEEIQEYKRG